MFVKLLLLVKEIKRFMITKEIYMLTNVTVFSNRFLLIFSFLKNIMTRILNPKSEIVTNHVLYWWYCCEPNSYENDIFTYRYLQGLKGYRVAK